MRIRDLLPISVRALVMNKSRSILTMLGIVIGIASVILMISVGQSAQQFLLSQVASFGSDLVFVSNGRGDETRGGPPSAAQKETLTEKDFQRLKSLEWPKAVSAAVMTSDLIEYGGQELRTSISGTAPDEIIVFSTRVDHGRFLDQADLDGRARVTILGKTLAEKLFGQEDPLGRTIKIAKQPYRVIGILEPVGTRFFTDIDNQAYIPFTAFFDLYNKNRLNFFEIKSGNVPPTDAKELIRDALRETHNINNPDRILSKDDFRVATQEDAIKNASTIGGILQILLGSIASISLFVAGIGIMNIMYVTVTERTREIGLRKAIGALERDILGQFLAEAVMLTATAGVIGIVFGFLFSWLAIQVITHFQTGWTFIQPWNGAAIGFTVSTAIGVFFGYFPARRAAKLHPIEALRYE